MAHGSPSPIDRPYWALNVTNQHKRCEAARRFDSYVNGKWADYPTFSQGSGSDNATALLDCRIPPLVVDPCPPACFASRESK